MNDQDFLTDIMGFNPSDLSVFNPVDVSSNVNPNIYKTNPVKLSKSDDGRYHSKIRILYNPFNVKQSIVHSVKYSMTDSNGFFMAPSSLAIGDRNCPIFKAWKKLHFSGEEAKDNWAKLMFNKEESNWVLVQIIEDDNQPELVGKIKIMKLPSAIYKKLDAKMNPTPESKKQPVALMDYLFGPVLEMEVCPGPDDKAAPERKQREISYELCDFEADPTPIVNVDGTQFFSDEELEIIDKYNNVKNAIAKAKTDKAKTEKQEELAGMKDAITAIYRKALAFMKENAIDLVEECGYKEWDENLTYRVNNWINLVLEMKDPAIEIGNNKPKTESKSESAGDDVFEDVMSESEEDMPF